MSYIVTLTDPPTLTREAHGPWLSRAGAHRFLDGVVADQDAGVRPSTLRAAIVTLTDPEVVR